MARRLDQADYVAEDGHDYTIMLNILACTPLAWYNKSFQRPHDNMLFTNDRGSQMAVYKTNFINEVQSNQRADVKLRRLSSPMCSNLASYEFLCLHMA